MFFFGPSGENESWLNMEQRGDEMSTGSQLTDRHSVSSLLHVEPRLNSTRRSDCAASRVTANQTIIPIMRDAAERQPVTSKEA